MLQTITISFLLSWDDPPASNSGKWRLKGILRGFAFQYRSYYVVSYIGIQRNILESLSTAVFYKMTLVEMVAWPAPIGDEKAVAWKMEMHEISWNYISILHNYIATYRKILDIGISTLNKHRHLHYQQSFHQLRQNVGSLVGMVNSYWSTAFVGDCHRRKPRSSSINTGKFALTNMLVKTTIHTVDGRHPPPGIYKTL